MAIARFQVTLFVDWDTARRLNWLPKTPGRDLRRAPLDDLFGEIYQMVASLLRREHLVPADVQVRLYHGFYQGITPTEDYRRLQGFRASVTQIERVVFGDPPLAVTRLACGGRYCELRHTLRIREDDGKTFEQKMVDTALASDLLYFARVADPSVDRFLVLADDTDMLPPIVLAKEWQTYARLVLTRGVLSKHLSPLLPLVLMPPQVAVS